MITKRADKAKERNLPNAAVLLAGFDSLFDMKTDQNSKRKDIFWARQSILSLKEVLSLSDKKNALFFLRAQTIVAGKNVSKPYPCSIGEYRKNIPANDWMMRGKPNRISNFLKVNAMRKDFMSRVFV